MSERLQLPEVTAKRGGLTYGEAHIPASAKRTPPPTYPTGHWQYGADIADYDDGDTEPEIVGGTGGWGSAFEPYLSAEDAASDWPGRPIVKRWIPAPGVWEGVAS